MNKKRELNLVSTSYELQKIEYTIHRMNEISKSQRDSLCLETFSKLESILTPFWYGVEIEIPPPSLGSHKIQPGLQAQLKISKSTRWGYHYNGQVLRCFSIANNNGKNNVMLGRAHVPAQLNDKGYNFIQGYIKCVTELSTMDNYEWEITKLLVGLDCGERGGYLVIFDPIRGRPVRWISLPKGVESIGVINHYKKTGTSFPFNDNLGMMFGIVSVGLSGGKIIILDLGLDDLIKDLEKKGYKTVPDTLEYKDEITYKLFIVDPNIEITEFTRLQTIQQKHLITIDLKNDEWDFEEEEDEDHNYFNYCNPEGELIERFHRKDIRITAMTYFNDIKSLIIGYNFGCFQIFRIDSIQLEYSSPYIPKNISIHSFEFQTPIDDPKYFCYLWILYGDNTPVLSQSRLELISLEYSSATQIGNTTIYSDFKQIMNRLSVDLEDSYFKDELDGTIIASECKDKTPIRKMVRPLRMWTQEKTNLLFVGWEGFRDGFGYLGVFDLDQWYSAQTPELIPIHNPDSLSSFWSSIVFESPGIWNGIEDIRIIPKTFGKHINHHTPQDIHKYPASINFQALCISSKSTFTFGYFGLQEKLLRLVQLHGYNLMAEPSHLRLLFSNFGLVPHYDPSELKHIDQQRKDQYYIFSGLLETTRSSLIIMMANQWLEGSHNNLGLNINLIFEWIWNSVKIVRDIADPHWDIALINQEITPDTTKFLTFSHFVWTRLQDHFSCLRRPLTLTQRETLKYDNLTTALQELVEYSSCLLRKRREFNNIITSPTQNNSFKLISENVGSPKKSILKKEQSSSSSSFPFRRNLQTRFCDNVSSIPPELSSSSITEISSTHNSSLQNQTYYWNDSQISTITTSIFTQTNDEITNLDEEVVSQTISFSQNQQTDTTHTHEIPIQNMDEIICDESKEYQIQNTEITNSFSLQSTSTSHLYQQQNPIPNLIYTHSNLSTENSSDTPPQSDRISPGIPEDDDMSTRSFTATLDFGFHYEEKVSKSPPNSTIDNLVEKTICDETYSSSTSTSVVPRKDSVLSRNNDNEISNTSSLTNQTQISNIQRTETFSILNVGMIESNIEKSQYDISSLTQSQTFSETKSDSSMDRAQSEEPQFRIRPRRSERRRAQSEEPFGFRPRLPRRCKSEKGSELGLGREEKELDDSIIILSDTTGGTTSGGEELDISMIEDKDNIETYPNSHQYRKELSTIIEVSEINTPNTSGVPTQTPTAISARRRSLRSSSQMSSIPEETNSNTPTTIKKLPRKRLRLTSGTTPTPTPTTSREGNESIAEDNSSEISELPKSKRHRKPQVDYFDESEESSLNLDTTTPLPSTSNIPNRTLRKKKKNP